MFETISAKIAISFLVFAMIFAIAGHGSLHPLQFAEKIVTVLP